MGKSNELLTKRKVSNYKKSIDFEKEISLIKKK